MLRGIWGDPERYQDTYWSRFEGRYFAGDGAKLDDDGYLWLLGRVDDVMNVSGHRISTTEVESALVDHPAVAEAAVVGAKDDTTGQAIIAFVTLRGRPRGRPTSSARSCASTWPRRSAPIARPKTVIFTDDLPKTRTGKIMRRLLRDVAEGRDLGDTTTLADPGVVEEIKRRRGRQAARTRSDAGLAADSPRRTGAGATAPSSRARPSSFDIDGVLSDAAGRQHFLEARRQATGRRSSTPAATTRSSTRWPACSSCSTATCAVVLLTGRPSGCSRQTLAWLERYGLRWDLLIMRDAGDYVAARGVQAPDRRRAARATASTSAWPSRTTAATSTCSTSEGVPCVYIHSGYYEN